MKKLPLINLYLETKINKTKTITKYKLILIKKSKKNLLKLKTKKNLKDKIEYKINMNSSIISKITYKQ